MEIRPIQASRGLLGASGDEVLDAMHVVSPDGRVLAGGEALPALLAALTGVPPLEFLLRSSSMAMTVLRVAYGLIAELRGHLICRHDALASATGPSEIARP